MSDVLMITPWYRDAVRGNAITVRRIERYVQEAGCSVDVLALEEDACNLDEHPVPPGTRVVHAFHALSAGRTARRMRREAGVPYIVTLTGTDIYPTSRDQRSLLQDVLRDAAGVVAFHPLVRERVLDAVPGIDPDSVSVIPQGVEPPAEEQIVFPDAPVFLLPAGLRPVKGVLEAIDLMELLAERLPSVRLMVAGPPVDAAYASQVLERLDRLPWAEYAGAVPHAVMGELYRQAAVVLNTSVSEGGMANALLEAFAWKRAVLAADVEGNRSIVSDGTNGLLYRSPEEFVTKGELLVRDAAFRRQLGEHGREFIAAMCNPTREGEAYAALYRKVW